MSKKKKPNPLFCKPFDVPEKCKVFHAALPLTLWRFFSHRLKKEVRPYWYPSITHSKFSVNKTGNHRPCCGISERLCRCKPAHSEGKC